MSEHHQHDFRNNEVPHSFLPSSMQKQNKINSPSSQIMNIKNPLAALNYMSIFRPISFDSSQPLINNHLDLINATLPNQQIDSNSSSYSTTQPSNFYEEPTLLKINIPIEMMVRTMSQQSSSPQNQCNHPAHACSTTQMPYQTSSDWTSKPATSFIRKAQEVFFGTNTNNDRGDVAAKSIRRADLPASDPRFTNEMNKSTLAQQQQQQAKNLHKPFQASQHQPMMSPCSDSYPKRCGCGSTLYPPM